MAAIVAPSKASSPSPAPAQSPSPSYFEIVTSNLLKLGALTLEDFLHDPYQEPTPQENSLSNPLYHDVPLVPLLVSGDQGPEKGKAAQTPAPIFILDQICSQTFGSVDALNYEIIEEEGKESKWFPHRPLPHAHPLLYPPIRLQRNDASSRSRGPMAQRAHTHRNPSLRARQRPALRPRP